MTERICGARGIRRSVKMNAAEKERNNPDATLRRIPCSSPAPIRWPVITAKPPVRPKINPNTKLTRL